MTEPTKDQKKTLYDGLPQEHKDKQTYTEWVKQAYNNQYNSWVPWLEDQYLAWFGNDNKASYLTKSTLNDLKITGIAQVDTLQDSVHGLAAAQLGKGGLAQPLGDLASAEAVNRAERGGRDDRGTYAGPMASLVDPMADQATRLGSGIARHAQ